MKVLSDILVVLGAVCFVCSVGFLALAITAGVNQRRVRARRRRQAEREQHAAEVLYGDFGRHR